MRLSSGKCPEPQLCPAPAQQCLENVPWLPLRKAAWRQGEKPLSQLPIVFPVLPGSPVALGFLLGQHIACSTACPPLPSPLSSTVGLGQDKGLAPSSPWLICRDLSAEIMGGSSWGVLTKSCLLLTALWLFLLFPLFGIKQLRRRKKKKKACNNFADLLVLQQSPRVPARCGEARATNKMPQLMYDHCGWFLRLSHLP